MAIKIGIPRALLYYHYAVLWRTFFKELGLQVLVSSKTTQETIEKGRKYVVDETCLAMKIFMGHVEELAKTCDYVLVPRLVCIRKKEKMCTNFSGLYDLTRNLFKVKILNYNVDVEHNESEFNAFLKMGEVLGFSLRKTANAYFKAKEKEQEKKLDGIDYQNLLLKQDSLKILLVGHPYNLYDQLVGGEISDYLKKEKVVVLYSDRYDLKRREEDAKLVDPNMYWTFNKDLVASLVYYRKKVDGVIIISSFPCGPDSLVNEMMVRKVKGVPMITLIRDELNSEVGLVTRLESFLDMIKERKITNVEQRSR